MRVAFIQEPREINLLAKNYSPLHDTIKITELLKSFYAPDVLLRYSRYELYQLLNRTVLKNYHGEEILKYNLFERHINKANIVAAFEMRVNNSRVDFLTINGHTKGYEIKSQLDSLTKLEKQAADYELVFDFNYLVIDEKHMLKAIDIVPEEFGIWTYNAGKFRYKRKAEPNNKIDPEVQLKLLTKRELGKFFPDVEPSIKAILKHTPAIIVNARFRDALKHRYRDRWNFLAENQKAILPLDVQFFFNQNIKPQYVYQY